MNLNQSSQKRLSLQLYRSLLRWNRKEFIRKTYFELHPERLGLVRAFPNISFPKKIHNKFSFAEIAKQVFRSAPLTSKSVDVGFSVLKWLNEYSKQLDGVYQEHCLAKRADIQEKLRFRVGEVLTHKTKGYRCIVKGWKVDEQSGKQLIDFLPDELDLAEGGASAAQVSISELLQSADADEFVLETNPLLMRVYNESTSKYFVGFDQKTNRFAPRPELSFLYPADQPATPAAGDNNKKSKRKSSSSSSGVEAEEKASSAVAESLSQLVKDLNGICTHYGFPATAGSRPAAALASNAASLIVSPIRSDAIVATDAHAVKAEVLKDILYFVQKMNGSLSPAHEPTVLPMGNSRQFVKPPLSQLSSYTPWGEHRDPRLEGDEAKMSLESVLYFLVGLYDVVNQMLRLRFQFVGEDRLDRLGEAYYSKLLGTGAVDSSDPTPDSPLEWPTYEVGQVLWHKIFKYRCVVAGYDNRPKIDVRNWEGVVNSKFGAQQPFYKVIPNEDDMEDNAGFGLTTASLYVAQENLEPMSPSDSKHKIDGPPIKNRELNHYFRGFDINSGRFIPPAILRFCFPSAVRSSGGNESVGVVPPSGVVARSEDAVAFRETEEMLLEIYHRLRASFLLSREEHENIFVQKQGNDSASTAHASDMPHFHVSDLLFLLRESRSREDSVGLEGLIWVISNCHRSPLVSKLIRKAGDHHARGEVELAGSCYQQILKLDKNFFEVENKLGALYYKANQPEECKRWTAQLLQVCPDHYAALAGYGLSQQKLGNRREAIKALSKSLQMHPWAAHVPTVLKGLLKEQLRESKNIAADAAEISSIVRKGRKRTKPSKTKAPSDPK